MHLSHLLWIDKKKNSQSSPESFDVTANEGLAGPLLQTAISSWPLLEELTFSRTLCSGTIPTTIARLTNLGEEEISQSNLYILF